MRRRAYRIVVFLAVGREPAAESLKPVIEEKRSKALVLAAEMVRREYRMTRDRGWHAIVEEGWLVPHRLDYKGDVFKIDPFGACLKVDHKGRVGLAA